jgi:hypothetical protein
MISAQTLRVCREGKPLHTFRIMRYLAALTRRTPSTPSILGSAPAGSVSGG